MTDKRIKEIVDFFYSSNSSKEIPFRLAIVFGMGGADISRTGLAKILRWLSSSEINKKSANKLLVELDSINERE